MSSSGYSDANTTPIGGQGHQSWHMGCAFVLHGITVALFDRMTSGEGQYIDVSIHDASAIGTEAAVPQWMYYGGDAVELLLAVALFAAWYRRRGRSPAIRPI